MKSSRNSVAQLPVKYKNPKLMNNKGWRSTRTENCPTDRRGPERVYVAHRRVQGASRRYVLLPSSMTAAHPRAQGAYTESRVFPMITTGSSPRTGSLR